MRLDLAAAVRVSRGGRFDLLGKSSDRWLETYRRLPCRAAPPDRENRQAQGRGRKSIRALRGDVAAGRKSSRSGTARTRWGRARKRDVTERRDVGSAPAGAPG